MKIALVHDDFIQLGGAEKLFAHITQIWPDAPIFTSCYDKEIVKNLGLNDRNIKVSFIQKLPFKKKLYRTYFPLYPLAFESFNFEDFDIVISSTTRFAKGIITNPKTCHIAYINSPPRFLWETNSYFEDERIPKYIYFLLMPVISLLRIWDQVSSSRVDYWVANSRNVAKRIRKRYQKEAEIIYPGIDLKKFGAKQKDGNFFLIVSRLAAWKKIEIAIEAFNKLKLPLIIIGDGPARKKLEKIAQKNIKFLGRLDDRQVISYFQKCKGFILTQEEDFGLTILEANACGKPVISFKGGGACELIMEKKNGIFFFPQNASSLVEAFKNFRKLKLSSSDCILNAKAFSKETFQDNLKKYVENTWQIFKTKN